jgi:hypothetical protein
VIPQFVSIKVCIIVGPIKQVLNNNDCMLNIWDRVNDYSKADRREGE